MRRHLPAMRIRILLRAHRRQQLFKRSHTKLKTKCAVSIVWIKPIVTRFENHAGGNQHSFMTGSADLKENFILSLELNLLIVKATRQVHHAVHVQQLRARQTVMLSHFRDVHTGPVFQRLVSFDQFQNFRVSLHTRSITAFDILRPWKDVRAQWQLQLHAGKSALLYYAHLFARKLAPTCRRHFLHHLTLRYSDSELRLTLDGDRPFRTLSPDQTEYCCLPDRSPASV